MEAPALETPALRLHIFRVNLMFIFLFLTININSSLIAQVKTLSIDESVKTAINNYPGAKLSKYEIDKAEGILKQAKVFPNPGLSFYKEKLKAGSASGGESIISIDYPLNFIWTKPAEIQKAKHLVEAKKYLHLDKIRNLSFEVQKSYIFFHYSGLNQSLLQSAVKILEKLNKSASERFSAGDISGYDLKRITIELIKFEEKLVEANLDYTEKQKHLLYLFGMGNEKIEIGTDKSFLKSIQETSIKRLIELSYKNRPDLLAFNADNESKTAAKNCIKRNSLPEINFLAGYKKQIDNYKGSVLQVNLSLPIFNRKQGKLTAADAEINKGLLTVELLKQQIRIEVETAFNSYSRFRKLIEKYHEFEGEFYENMLQSAGKSYEEGEMTLLEYIDAVNAYFEAIKTKNSIKQNLYVSVYELGQAIGTPAK